MENNFFKSIFLTNNNPYLFLPPETCKMIIYDMFGLEIYQKSKFNSLQTDLSEIAYKPKIL